MKKRVFTLISGSILIASIVTVATFLVWWRYTPAIPNSVQFSAASEEEALLRFLLSRNYSNFASKGYVIAVQVDGHSPSQETLESIKADYPLVKHYSSITFDNAGQSLKEHATSCPAVVFSVRHNSAAMYDKSAIECSWYHSVISSKTEFVHASKKWRKWVVTPMLMSKVS